MLTEKGDRLVARKESLAAWAPRTSEESSRNAWLADHYEAGGLGMQLLLTSPPKMDLAILWAKGLEADEGKAQMLSEIARLMVNTSPADAIKLGDELQGEDYLHFLGRFGDGWARKEGKAALNWSMQVADPTLRESVQQSINSTWAIFDLDGAKAHLQTLPPGPTRESLLRSIAARLAEDNTPAAFSWLQQLPTPAEQRLAQNVLQNIAPVGIGANLTMDEGLPVVTNMLPLGSAGMSQQVQKGDGIVAVDAYGNGFVSTTGLELEQVVKLIGGRPGTTVRLQVSKVNSRGFDAPRVVVLPRLQVLHLPDK